MPLLSSGPSPFPLTGLLCADEAVESLMGLDCKPHRRQYVERGGARWLSRGRSMVYYDHALVGATLSVAAGMQRRYGWPAVMLAALAGMFPDWDAIPKHTWPQAYVLGHRV